MSGGPLTVWTNTAFPEPADALLRAGVAPHRLVYAAERFGLNLVTGAPDAALAGADVAFGQPSPDQVLAATRLRWVHLNSAGYASYDRDDLRGALAARGGVLTTSSGVYDEACAEHVLAMMLALARRLPQALDAQRTDRGWDSVGARAASRLLVGERVVLLGFGAIARRLVELLAPFRMDVVAVRRHARGDEPVRVVAESELDAHLAAADHVVNLLPGGAGTVRLMDARRIAAVKPGARFYNVGRGTTVDQDALVAALCSGRLGAAYLDVTDPEPPPPDHPLWAAPNCYVTPHSAGGQVREMEAIVGHFLANLRRFAADGALADRVL